MGRSVKFTSRFGIEYELMFERVTYQHGGTVAICVWCKDCVEGYWEPYADLTVNLPERVHSPNHAFLDTNNNPDLCQFVIDSGWAHAIGEGTSGFCTYPLALFTDEFLDEICMASN